MGDSDDQQAALARLKAAQDKADAGRRELDDAVHAARAAGATWADIGAALGTTRQAAWERWGK